MLLPLGVLLNTCPRDDPARVLGGGRKREGPGTPGPGWAVFAEPGSGALGTPCLGEAAAACARGRCLQRVPLPLSSRRGGRRGLPGAVWGVLGECPPRGVSRAAPCHCHTEASPTLPEPRRPYVHAWPGLATPGGTKAGRVSPEPLVCSLFSAAPRSQHSPVPGLTLSRAGCGRTLATSCRVP